MIRDARELTANHDKLMTSSTESFKLVSMQLKKNAFSLVELSIVLVILGLLTGGILGGQALIRAAELRAVSAEYQRYTSAAYSFRDKYFALPGDLRDATRFWGFAGTTAAPACVSNSGITAVTAPGTCDGDGDGLVGSGSAAGQTAEFFQFWNQLALAGLIEGTYNGLSGTGGVRHSMIGTNVPRSKLSNAGWSVSYTASNFAGDGAGFSAAISTYNNHYRFGSQAPTEHTQGPALKPEEAWNIDTKMDDGNPVRGRIFAYLWTTCTTAANNADAAALYRLDSTATACALFVSLGQ